MNKYIVINAFCDNENISYLFVRRKLVARCHMSKVYSKYYLNNTIEDKD